VATEQSEHPTTTVAVLGTGTMGEPMARNLLAPGLAVRVWNRSREKAEPLGREGAVVADTPAGAVDGADAVLTMLADADAIERVMVEGRGLEAMEDDAVWIQSSTVGVAGIERLAALAGERGVAFVDAPVLGTRKPAEEAKLVILASGPEELRARCEPIFDAVGSTTRWVGEIGAGSRLKMVTNLWLLAVLEAAAESIALAGALGLDPRLFLDTMEGSQIDTPYLHIKGEAILSGRLEPSFTLRLAEKDISLVEDTARRAGLDVPLAHTIRERFGRGIELGHGDEDMAATYYATAVAA
jgi:3-hydroxyisobutyrate dehydrogenase